MVGAGRVVAAGTPAELTSDGGAVAEVQPAPGLDLRGLAAALPAGVRVSESRPGRYVAQGGAGRTGWIRR